jgi:hypothetical protein
MDCELALLLLYDIVDGELASEDRPIIETHLQDCAACRAQLDVLQNAETYYRHEMQADMVAPDAGLARQITAKIWPENRAVVPIFNWSTRAIIARVGAAAAGLAAMLYLVISLPYTSQLSFRATEISSAFNPVNSFQSGAIWRTIIDLQLNLICQQLFETTIVASSRLIGKLPVNGSIIFVLVLLQIIASYRLLSRTGDLEQDKQL